MILLALLPISPALHEKATALEKRAYYRHNTTIIQACLGTIFEYLRMPSETGVALKCADGHFRLCYPIVAAWCADHEEKVNKSSLILQDVY